MRHAIESREPLTEQEVWDYLSIKVDREEKQWGKDYIYSQWAREYRDKQMAKFKAGEVVEVHTESFVDSYGNGCGNFEDVLYSDGSVKTACYGYLD